MDMCVSPLFFSFPVASPPSCSLHPLLWLHPGCGHLAGTAPPWKSQNSCLPLSDHSLPLLLSPSLIHSRCSGSSAGTSHSLALFSVPHFLLLSLLIACYIDPTVHRSNDSFNFNAIALLSFCHISQTNPGWFQSPALSAPLACLLSLFSILKPRNWHASLSFLFKVFLPGCASSL